MSDLLDEEYLVWLYAQVGTTRLKNPERTYWFLARQLLKKEFVWLVPNDDNRVEDGRDLRIEFLAETGIEEVDPDWMDLGCSFLELLIVLSRDLSFQAEGEVADWFGQLLHNIGLDRWNDKQYKKDPDAYEAIEEIVNAVIYRQYREDGQGGLFPLEAPRKDQRDVELWYQMCAYILERQD